MNRPEFELIDWIRARVDDRAPVMLGIGDDAACLRQDVDRDMLVAIDMLMEGTHFTFPEATSRLAGRKALAVNLSDIAAMAGRPTAAFISGRPFSRLTARNCTRASLNRQSLIVMFRRHQQLNGPLVVASP